MKKFDSKRIAEFLIEEAARYDRHTADTVRPPGRKTAPPSARSLELQEAEQKKCGLFPYDY